jgi:hypothetical protein
VQARSQELGDEDDDDNDDDGTDGREPELGAIPARRPLLDTRSGGA